MKIEKFGVYSADLNPRMGTEAGKIRPVVVVQTDLLNGTHPSTLICPLTTQLAPNADILRVHLTRGEAGLREASDVLTDQIRAIDNRRFKKRLGRLSAHHQQKILDNLKILILE